MRFLLDENLSPIIADLLSAAGHDTTHTRALGLAKADDLEVFAMALAERRCIISSDTDFGEILARTSAELPSLILLRRQDHRRASEIAALILTNLDTVASDLDSGAIVVLDDSRLRVRPLPLRPS